MHISRASYFPCLYDAMMLLQYNFFSSYFLFKSIHLSQKKNIERLQMADLRLCSHILSFCILHLMYLFYFFNTIFSFTPKIGCSYFCRTQEGQALYRVFKNCQYNRLKPNITASYQYTRLTFSYKKKSRARVSIEGHCVLLQNSPRIKMFEFF